MPREMLTFESQNVINCCKNCERFNFMYEEIIVNGGKPIFRNYNCKMDCPMYLSQKAKYDKIKRKERLDSLADRQLIETALFKRGQREGRISSKNK